MEGIPASCQYLVSVGLMPHVPDDAILRSVEHIVQGNGQFHYSQTAGEVSWIPAQFVNKESTQFLTQPWQVLQRQFP